jgi:hypothetical protein
VTFAKAAFARVLLRALAGEKLRPETEKIPLQAQDPNSKTAEANAMGAISGAVGAVGSGVNKVWQASMKHNGPFWGTVGMGLGAAGLYALGKHSINQTRAAYQGFDPEVQAYTRQSPY